MQYYVGSWACTGGMPGKAQNHATLSYTMDDGMLREWIVVPVQSGQKTPFGQELLTTYDASHGRFVQVYMDSAGEWGVTYVTLNGNTETGVDHATSSGHLGHGMTKRMGSTFTYTGYPTLTSTTPNFKATCHRT